MIATDRGRWVGLVLVALGALGSVGGENRASAQGFGRPKSGQAPALPEPSQEKDSKVRFGPVDKPRFVEDVIPVNPTDPIAIINNEVITRQQLADEAVVRTGKKVLEDMIRFKLIDQALKEMKLTVSAADIDQEIDQIANRMAGIGREAWLRTLDKERGISPAQYARDIIYPSIALRKLASGRVQVTETELKDSMEANFGPKLFARILTIDRERSAIEIWEKLKKNPAGFEKEAREKSTDEATRALGGYLSTPIVKFMYPRDVTEKAFIQLVEGDKDDKDPTHLPKDGDLSGPIQINEMAWIIFKRERVEPAMQYDPNDPKVRAAMHAQLADAKLQEEMKKVLGELMERATVDNRLTGTLKSANEMEHPIARGVEDKDIKLMSNPAPVPSSPKTAAGRAASAASTKALSSTPPVGLPADVASGTEKVRKTLQGTPK